MANKNNFVKLGLIRTFTMTNFAILLRCVCVRVWDPACVWDPAWIGAHEYCTFLLPMSMYWIVRRHLYDVCTVEVQINMLFRKIACPSLLCVHALCVFSLCVCVKMCVCVWKCVCSGACLVLHYRVIWLPFTHQHTTSSHNGSTVKQTTARTLPKSHWNSNKFRQ